jgi:hypothetical protein
MANLPSLALVLLAFLQTTLAFGENGETVANMPIAKRAQNHWVDAWTAMPQLTEAANLPPSPFVRA